MNTDNEPNKPDDVVGLDFDKITSNPVTPIGIFILQLIALLIFAKKSGVDYIVVMLDKLIGSLTKRMGDE